MMLTAKPSAIASYLYIICGLVAVLCLPTAMNAAEPAPLRWLSDVNVAYREALAQKRPILIRATGPSCPWCEKLNIEIGKPEVQTALADWTLVSIDVDKSPNDALRMNVNGIPALRALTPRGRIVASQDGFLEADDLLIWMKESLEKATSTADDVLLSDHEPNTVEIVRIVRMFSERDAEVREAALRRVLPFPQTAAGPVVDVLKEGSLSSRLVAFELLGEWHAPLGEYDPWQPETLTDERYAAVTEWLKTMDALPPPGTAKELSEDDLKTARRDIEMMLKADRSEAVAVRERLARLGRGILPEVLKRLNEAATDDERERLVMLRYRLAAADSLVLAWPGGLERLADHDSTVRHRAAEELAARATADEQALLLELFSDADPLVREISLRGLRNVGGEKSTAALVDLLNDPEPNVRAAVLKQLAEDKSPAMLDKIAEYVEHEEDADLVVHAIRYLRETNGPKATETLLSLLKHDSWQVRAEAAESIGKLAERSYHTSSFSHSRGADNGAGEIQDALLNLLADPDSFVVSRALGGLKGIDSKRAVEPLVKAAAAHPSLASQIIDVLAAGTQMRTTAVPHLRAFFKSPDSAVRAAAIRGLCKTDPKYVKDDLLAAIRDEQTLVRTSAAKSLLEMIDVSRPGSNDTSIGMDVAAPTLSLTGLLGGLFGGRAKPAPQEPPVEKDEDTPTEPDSGEKPEHGDSQEEEASDAEDVLLGPLDAWLEERNSGKLKAEWMSELHEPLLTMLGAENIDERLAAAMVLIPFGDADRALPVLLAISAEQPALLPEAAKVLRWLVWTRRVEVFEELYKSAHNDTDRTTIVAALNTIPDFRVAELYWKALDRPDATKSLAATVQRGLRRSYFGDSYYDLDSISSRTRKRAVAAVKPKLEDGPPLKRLVAIDLLLKFAPDAALTSAERLMTDESADEALRSDAFQITLAAQTSSNRTTAAIESLSGADAHRRAVSLKYLALGSSSLRQLPTTGFTIDFEDNVSYRSSSGAPIVPEPPSRLKAEDVAPLVDDADHKSAAYAGYLLTLFSDSAGLEPLLRYWRTQPTSDELDRLVYRAIAVLDDAEQLPALKQIYGRLDQYEKQEFYWTIRIMSGSEILAFRKQIREEVGISNLR
ncbi:MAG: HEAT repeat domain-containing protein [Planctomycetaceae bacterium]